MLRTCVEIVQKLLNSSVVYRVRSYPTTDLSAHPISQSLGKARLIHSSARMFSVKLYRLIVASLSLLKLSFTHFPQHLLLLREKI